METRHYLTCLWPGMAELWWRGRLSALPAAIGFALALNLYLVARYLYPEWLAPGLVKLGFWVGIPAWGFCVARNVRELPSILKPRATSDQPDRFPEARNAFLRGSWSEAEGLLTDVLAIEPRDPPALFLLTGVYRHTGRLEAAKILLQEIKRLEIADAWWMEWEAENQRLRQAFSATQEEATEDPETEPAADLTAESPQVAGESTNSREFREFS